jgi:hypothetical protein
LIVLSSGRKILVGLSNESIWCLLSSLWIGISLRRGHLVTWRICSGWLLWSGILLRRRWKQGVVCVVCYICLPTE